MDYDVKLWTKLRDEARRGVLKKLPTPIFGSDLRKDAVAFSRSNARAAGIGHLIDFEVHDVSDFQPPAGPPGTVVCNPPYGERIGEEKDLKPLYWTLGEVLQKRCSGWTAFVFTGNASLAKCIGITPAARIPLFNGKIPCQLLRFDLN